ncbi:M24 family metallopeptidase [bacterium]|nr:M24 family metallopeptidase [bacterium]
MSVCYLIIDHKGIHPGVEQLFSHLKTKSRWCYLAILPDKKCTAFVFSIEKEAYENSSFEAVHSFYSKKALLEALALFLKGKKVFVDEDIVPFKKIEELKALSIDVHSAEVYRQQIYSLSPSMVTSHQQANSNIEQIMKNFAVWFAKEPLLTEKNIVDWLLKEIERRGMETISHPIVAYKENSALPHYHLEGEGASILGEGPLLIDLWARLKEPNAIYADRTFLFMVNREPNLEEKEAFSAVLTAQKKAFQAIGAQSKGSYVDAVARAVLEEKGYKENILHRLGHSIDRSLHGLSMHFDSVEEPDERVPVKNMVASIEPAVYIPKKFGVRLESNIFIDENLQPQWTNPLQEGWILLIH